MLSSHKMTLAILPSDRTERYLLPILLIMFVLESRLLALRLSIGGKHAWRNSVRRL
jgi:hypothetical protein